MHHDLVLVGALCKAYDSEELSKTLIRVFNAEGQGKHLCFCPLSLPPLSPLSFLSLAHSPLSLTFSLPLFLLQLRIVALISFLFLPFARILFPLFFFLFCVQLFGY